jgi:hypothetical protein
VWFLVLIFGGSGRRDWFSRSLSTMEVPLALCEGGNLGFVQLRNDEKNQPCEGSSHGEDEVDVLYYLFDTHDLTH